MPQVKRSRGGVQPLALTRQDVVDAGAELVAAGGIEALSVSAVARLLGVSTPAVYHYVESKEDLLHRVCESIARSVTVPDDTSRPWDDRIVEIVLSMNATFARYPGVAARILPFRDQSRAASRLADEVRQCLLDGGFSDADAEEVHAGLHFIFGGWLLGRRPTLPEGLLTEALLERSVRWLLAGAVEDCRPH